MRLVDDYLLEIELNIRNDRARKIVYQKVEKHLNRRIRELMNQKYDEINAAKQAIDEMGDAQTIAPALEKACATKWSVFPVAAAFIGFIALFFVSNGFSILSYINLIDWEGHDLKSDWISTMLFCGLSVFIFVGLKTKNKIVLWLAGIFVSGFLLISFFTGLFQPLWYSWVTIITQGWHGYLQGLFSFSELPYGPGLLVGFLGFATDISIIVFCVTAAIKINCELLWIIKPRWWKRFGIFSYSLLVFSATSLIILAAGTNIAGGIHRTEVNAQAGADHKDYKKALNIYFGLDLKDIIAAEKDNKSDYDFGSCMVQFTTTADGENGKRVFIYHGYSLDPATVKKAEGIIKLEDFKKVMLPEYSDEIWCTYLKSGDIEERYDFHTENKFTTDYYYYTFTNGILTDYYSTTSKDSTNFYNIF